ncbi:hypothetical protein [Phytoactinopolyspora halotolerans]|uniref:Uncharacterized protein n=1 Tax=Phytoactinopolyspora halotolerans TaxID=1981512 RepID=A0A6L9S646_9ACTN|nr:hypothetical protein [Phytoactinopolyspora halotolerans]NEE00124.1 hypothetical protein [Phytoactinopolyspora halotolerans]
MNDARSRPRSDDDAPITHGPGPEAALDEPEPPSRWIRFVDDGWPFFASVVFGAMIVVLYALGSLTVVVNHKYDDTVYHCTNAREDGADSSELPALVHLDKGWVPPKAECLWEDGQTIDLVPAFVSQGLAISLVGLTAAIATIVVHHRRQARHADQADVVDGEPDEPHER